MTIQEAISIFLTGQSNKYNIDPTLAAELQKSKAAFDKDHMTFVVEPVETKLKTFKVDDNTIYGFSGSFVWGFQKEGVLHAIPGDLSTQKTREELIDHGTFAVATDVNGVVTGIEESFAGNKYGKISGSTSGTSTKSNPKLFWFIVAAGLLYAAMQLI